MFLLQAEDGIRVLVRSRGLGDVYKRQVRAWAHRFQGKLRVGDDRAFGGTLGALIAAPPSRLSLIHI